jgi:hypothetical protein
MRVIIKYTISTGSSVFGPFSSLQLFYNLIVRVKIKVKSYLLLGGGEVLYYAKCHYNFFPVKNCKCRPKIYVRKVSELINIQVKKLRSKKSIALLSWMPTMRNPSFEPCQQFLGEILAKKAFSSSLAQSSTTSKYIL